MTQPPHPPQTPRLAESSGKVALITGGAKRVGKAVALRLAQLGMDVAITCRTSRQQAQEVADLIQQMGRQAMVIEVDMGNADAADRVHDALTQRFSRLDALVNNASVFDPSPLGGLTAEQFDRQMHINARGPILLMQRLADLLKAKYQADDPTSTGRIVNFIDIHVMGQPLKGWMAYNCSKAALMEATMTAAMELAPQVTVNALAPGVVAWADSYTPEQRERYLRRVPLARPGTPDDAADAAAYLITQAHYCTGQIIRLDGGRLLT